MKNLVTRSLSGIVYVALIVLSVLGGWDWFGLLSIVFTAFAVIEFEKIVVGSKSAGIRNGLIAFDVVVALIVVSIMHFLDCPYWLLGTFALLILCYTLIRFTLALYDKSTTAFADCAWSVLTIVYIAVPFAMLNAMSLYCEPWQTVVLAMFIMIWLNDTGAYCVGSLCGKHKMFPRLSPKKSWEGFAGGLFFCIAAGVAAAFIFPDIFSLPLWILFGIMVCALSTWGDLFESLLKRSHAIKDSGHLIPGHGGILDRIDSLLFVSIGVFIFTLLFV